MMADNLFNMSIPQLQRWKSGDVVEHSHLNQPIEAIDRLSRGLKPPGEVVHKKAKVEAAAGVQIRPVVLLGSVILPAVGELLLLAYPVKEVDGVWHVAGDAEFLNFWPGLTDRHYQPLYATDIVEGTLASKHHVVPAIKMGDEWYAMQHLRFAANPNPAGVAYGDCVL